MATKIRVNPKGVKIIHERLLSGKKDIKKAELDSLGFDTSSKKFEIGNIKFEKDMLFETFYFSVKDKLRDLDEKLISENQKLMQRIHVLWEAEKKEISFKDLAALNIPAAASELKIGNVLLSNYIGIDKSYDIELINKNKNIDNKWIDSSVTMARVKDVLSDFDYNKKMFALAEVPLNKELEIYFKQHFVSVKKSDTSNKGLIDLTIGNEKNKIALELKLSRKIKQSSESQKCRGQIEDYNKQYGSNLILVIAGEAKDKQEKYLQECTRKAETLGMSCFFMAFH